MKETDLPQLIAAIDQLKTRLEDPSALSPEAWQRQRTLLEQAKTYLLSYQAMVVDDPRAETIAPDQLTQYLQTAIAKFDGDWINAVETLEQRLAVVSREKQSLLTQLQQLEIRQQKLVQDFVQDFAGRLALGGQQRLSQLATELTAQILALPLPTASPDAQTGATTAPLVPSASAQNASPEPDEAVWNPHEELTSDSLSTELANAETQFSQTASSSPGNLLSPPEVLPESDQSPQASGLVEAASPSVPETDIIQSLTELTSAPDEAVDQEVMPWYLGLDFGSTGISAVLLDANNADHYPLAWRSESAPSTTTKKLQFRLPTLAYFDWRGDDPHDKKPIFVVGAEAETLAKQQTGIFLDNFKPYLNLAVPYFDEIQKVWQPIFHSAGEQTVSLRWVQQALQTLLATLKTSDNDTTAAWQVEAVGLSSGFTQQVLRRLAGVICTVPTYWSDTYRFNVREALLQVQLIHDPGRVYFVEETIAILCSQLPWRQALDTSQSLVADSQASVPSLVISAGATAIELGFVNLPRDSSSLSHGDFQLASMAYGGYALDQDILIRLLYPQWRSQLQPNTFHLDAETLPRPGFPDAPQRANLAYRLQCSAVGRSFLAAARQLKQILQHQSEYQAQFRGQPWQVTRQEIIHEILRPFIYQLNRELNELLHRAGHSEQTIAQVICSGGTMAILWQTLSGWLSQKFPNATLVAHPQKPNEATPVAIGLGRVALFPSVIAQDHHQYNDYFLLHELLQVVPNDPFSFETIVQLLRQRGINTRVCASRILAILHGRLPTGLEMTPDLMGIYTPGNVSPHQATVLFSQTKNGRYYANLKACQNCRERLAAILSHAAQQLSEPLLIHLGTS